MRALLRRFRRRGSAVGSPNTSASVRKRRCEPEATSSGVSAPPVPGVPFSGVLISGGVAVPAAWSQEMAVPRRAPGSHAEYQRFPLPARVAGRAHRSARIPASGLVAFAFVFQCLLQCMAMLNVTVVSKYARGRTGFRTGRRYAEALAARGMLLRRNGLPQTMKIEYERC